MARRKGSEVIADKVKGIIWGYTNARCELRNAHENWNVDTRELAKFEKARDKQKADFDVIFSLKGIIEFSKVLEKAEQAEAEIRVEYKDRYTKAIEIAAMSIEIEKLEIYHAIKRLQNSTGIIHASLSGGKSMEKELTATFSQIIKLAAKLDGLYNSVKHLTSHFRPEIIKKMEGAGCKLSSDNTYTKGQLSEKDRTLAAMYGIKFVNELFN